MLFSEVLKMINYKFRKLPIVIEAFQMTRERRWDNKDWPEWLYEAWSKNPNEINSFFCMFNNADHLKLNTLQGEITVSYNDYIIKGVKGELYPCKPEIFKTTYEEEDAIQ